MHLGLKLGLGGRSSLWTPAQFAKSGYAPFWDVYGTNWQDVSDTTPAEDVTDSLAKMDDGSGDGYHASNAVTAQQPMIDEIDVGTFTHRYAYHDLDDSLTATLPDMGTEAVVWSADIAGITIEPEATIGAGSY